MSVRGSYIREAILAAGRGYRSAEVAIRDKRTGAPGSHEAHTEAHRSQLINLSRAYKRDNPLYQGSIFRASQFAIGTGFKLQLSPASESSARVENYRKMLNAGASEADLQLSPMEMWCLDTERRFGAWWCSNAKVRSRKKDRESWLRFKPDIKQVLTGPRIEALAMREILTCGDGGMVLLGEPGMERVQLVEAEQIAGERAVFDDGIAKDKAGQPTGYYVCPYKNGQLDYKGKIRYSTEEFLFFCSDPERATGIRGVPPLQASFAMLDRLNDICDAEALAWQIQSRLAAIINTEEGAAIDIGSRSDPSSNDPDESLGSRITDVDYALLFTAKPGEDIRGFERTAPSKSFREVFREMVRVTGLPINMALEFLLLDMSESNYSQVRALIALFAEWILGYQMSMSGQLHDPLFDWWLWGRMYETDDKSVRIPEPPEDYEVNWIYPTFPGIDLKAETAAWESQIRLGINSYSAAVKGQNKDPDTVRAQKEADRVAAIRAARRIEILTGVKVDWQGLCGEPIPGAAPGVVESPMLDKDKDKGDDEENVAPDDEQQDEEDSEDDEEDSKDEKKDEDQAP